MQINENKGSKISDFAQNYMKKLGWSEGKGLGKDESGIDTHIKVKKKDEATGLGLDQAVTEQRVASEQWWHDGFSQSLKALSNKKKKKSKKRKHDEDDDVEKQPSYDDLFKATGGARLGMRARASQNGKFLRTEHDADVLKLSVRGEGADVESSSCVVGAQETTLVTVADSEDEASKKTLKKEKKDKKERKREKKAKRSNDSDEE